MRIKPKNIVIASIMGCALISGGIGIGFSIKSANEVKLVAQQLNEETEESKIDKLKAKVDELLNSTLIKSIVSYSTTIAGLTGFIVTLAKYKKFKALTTEDMTKVASNVCTDQLKDIEEKIIKELIKKFGNVENAMAEVVTVMAMMQDTTTKGRQALIEYLAKRTAENESVSEEAKEIVEEVKENVTEEVEKEEEIKETVKEDYSQIE